MLFYDKRQRNENSPILRFENGRENFKAMKNIFLAILCWLFSACASLPPAPKPTQPVYAGLLELELAYPLREVKLSPLQDIPEESAAHKFSHLQQAIQKSQGTENVLPLSFSDGVETLIVPARKSRFATGLPLVSASVQDSLTLMAEMLDLEIEYSQDRIIVSQKH